MDVASGSRASKGRATHRLVVEQCGVVRREQLYALGIDRKTLLRRVHEGLWEPVGRRVLVWAGTADTLLTSSLAAAHAVFPAGTLTGWSALAVEGLADQDPWRVVPHDPMPWIRIRDHRKLRARVIRAATEGKIRRMLGVPVAGQETVITDLLRFSGADEARSLLFRLAQTMGTAKLATLLTHSREAVGKGRGARQLAQLAELLTSGAHSDAEGLLVRLLREGGFRDFVVNHPVVVEGRRFRIDVAFPERRLAVEVDGRAFHVTADRFQTDRTRQNLLSGAGWRVLRFTWEDLTRRPDHVLRQIAEMLG